MIRKRLKSESRTEDQIREHYEIELQLAKKLKESTKAERESLGLYTALYDELFSRVPHHQQLAQRESCAERDRSSNWQMGLLRRFLNDRTTFLEIGPGDCSLSFEVSKIVERVCAVDVSNVVTDHSVVPENFELSIANDARIPLPDESVDLVYSNQLMEHIHVDDVFLQLKEIYRILKPGGRYVCITPNRVSGPWDISYYFDDVACGFHLKEYSIYELTTLFRRVGLSRFRSYAGARGRYVVFPCFIVGWLEALLLILPNAIRLRIGRSLLFRMILGIRLAARK